MLSFWQFSAFPFFNVTNIAKCVFVFAILLESKGIAQQVQFIETEVEKFGCKVSYLGEPAVDGLLALDANNGFFDKGSFQAHGKKKAPGNEKNLISSHFTHLTTGDRTGVARWHFWLAKTGASQS